MQGIDNNRGTRYNYWPDEHPSSYEYCTNIIAIFKVKPKKETYSWKLYCARKKWEKRWNYKRNLLQRLKRVIKSYATRL